jgi:hypothetical protein
VARVTQPQPAKSKPSELAITLAALHHRYSTEPGWLYASQIVANLKLLGFEVNSRALAGTLGRMCRVDAPWLERRRSPFNDYEYRVTRYGRNDIDNKLGGVRVY